MSELCLTLLCPPAIEEKLLDLLLMSSDITTFFSSSKTAAHGLAHERLSQAEQVLGRALATEVKVFLAEGNQVPLLDNIRAQFAGAGLRYWLTPVLDSGEIV